MEVPDESILPGAKLAMTPGGSASALSATLPVNRFNADTVTVKTALLPPFTDCRSGETARSKSGRLTVTLSNWAVLDTAALCAVTARPARTLLDMAIAVMPAPACVQAWPSAEEYAMNVFPERTSRTQYGIVGPLTSIELAALPPVVARYCTLTPCEAVGVT